MSPMFIMEFAKTVLKYPSTITKVTTTANRILGTHDDLNSHPCFPRVNFWTMT